MDRYVPLPTYLTAPVEDVTRANLAIPSDVDTYELGAAFKQCRVRIHQANGQLKELRELGSD